MGFALFLTAVIGIKLKNNPEVPEPLLSLEDQFAEALEAGYPVFVFLHSLDCIPCQVMMENVAKVYPEYESEIVLIDVDVYDQNNQNIIRQEQLRAIPTLVFYDSWGNRNVHIGVLDTNQLQQVFQSLAGGD